MNWSKEVVVRMALRFSDFISLIKGIAFFDQVLLRDMQSMTWDRVLTSPDRTSAGANPGPSKERLRPSQRRRAETTRLSR